MDDIPLPSVAAELPLYRVAVRFRRAHDELAAAVKLANAELGAYAWDLSVIQQLLHEVSGLIAGGQPEAACHAVAAHVASIPSRQVKKQGQPRTLADRLAQARKAGSVRSESKREKGAQNLLKARSVRLERRQRWFVGLEPLARLRYVQRQVPKLRYKMNHAANPEILERYRALLQTCDCLEKYLLGRGPKPKSLNGQVAGAANFYVSAVEAERLRRSLGLA